MGLFRMKIEAATPIDRRFEEIETVVDTVAFFSMFPSSPLHQLGIASDSEREFTLVDGRKQTYPMGEARFRCEGLERTSSVIFGPEGAYLLGRSLYRASILSRTPLIIVLSLRLNCCLWGLVIPIHTERAMRLVDKRILRRNGQRFT